MKIKYRELQPDLRGLEVIGSRIIRRQRKLPYSFRELNDLLTVKRKVRRRPNHFNCSYPRTKWAGSLVVDGSVQADSRQPTNPKFQMKVRWLSRKATTRSVGRGRSNRGYELLRTGLMRFGWSIGETMKPPSIKNEPHPTWNWIKRGKYDKTSQSDLNKK